MVNVSIIVTCEEQQPELMRLLPELLSMRYDGEYEVIVVDKIHDKDMAEWLEEMEARYPHLCHTFCSATARGVDIHRLALTLGAKASAYDWLVVMPASAILPSEDWLSRLTASCGDDVDVVMAGKKHRWYKLILNIFRRRRSIYSPTSSIFLCRRSILLQAEPHIPRKRIVRNPL